MTDRMRIRIISLLEDAGNSFEQLETMTNRFLDDHDPACIDEVCMKAISREVLDDDDDIIEETDHIMYIRYRMDTDLLPAIEDAGADEEEDENDDDDDDQGAPV